MEKKKETKLNDNQMLITDEDGKDVLCNILFTYDNEERGCSYVVFSPDGDDDSIFAMRYKDNGELEYIEDEEEVNEVQEVLDAFLDSKEKGDIK